MRLSLVIAAFSMLGLAACSSAPKAPATPVQANQASQGQTQAADQQAEPVRHRRKYMNTGSRLPTESADPSVSDGGPAGGLTNNTSNVPF